MTLPIVTERLVLRRPVIGDVAAIAAIQADPDVAAETTEIGTTPEAIAKYIGIQQALDPFQLGKCFDLFIEVKATGDLAGLVSLVHRKPSQGQIGWALHTNYRGLGYATEAAIALTEYAFGTLGLHRIYADTSIESRASWRVMERVGLVREGRFREAGFKDGNWHDVVVYGATEDSWPGGQRPNEIR